MCISIVSPTSIKSLREVPGLNFYSGSGSIALAAESGLSTSQALHSRLLARITLGLNVDTGHTCGSFLTTCSVAALCQELGENASPTPVGDEPLCPHFVIRSQWSSIKLRTVILLQGLTLDAQASQSCNPHLLINFVLLN